MPYLVDGNNLAHALGLSRGSRADRETCARVLAAFCRSRGARATVVFDGPAPATPLGAGEPRRLRVVFSEGRTADEVILGQVKASRAPRDLIVVTSDKSLGDRARHMGADRERVHEFARRLGPRSVAAGAREEKPEHPQSQKEIDDWLEVFDPRRRR